MISESELLENWQWRTPKSVKQLSPATRQQWASFLIQLLHAQLDVNTSSATSAPASDLATSVMQSTLADDLDAVALNSDLRNGQLSLIDKFIQESMDGDSGVTCAERSARYPCSEIKAILSATDVAIQSVISHLNKQPPGVSEHDGLDTHATKAKSLQHEIRTPLQGALLTSELVLEDIANGDPVSRDDMRSIRQSIETAVRILNDFAAQKLRHRSSPD